MLFQIMVKFGPDQESKPPMTFTLYFAHMCIIFTHSLKHLKEKLASPEILHLWEMQTLVLSESITDLSNKKLNQFR